VSVIPVVFISYALQCCVGTLKWSSWLSIILVHFSVMICQLVVVCLTFVEDTLNTTELLWLCACVRTCVHFVCVCVFLIIYLTACPVTW